MIATDAHAALAQHPFLAGLDESWYDRLAEHARIIGVPAGQFLGRVGQPADALFLILSGRVSIEHETGSHEPVRITCISAGEVVGWSWLTAPYRWRFTARVLESVRALELDGPSLRRLCDENRELGFELLKRLVEVISERLVDARTQIQPDAK
jgi:CRP-like cAMP-binding protein